ncbi:MAG TPA: tetratricopeptide repeat protein [Chthoniobacterales bacterium]
MSKSHDTSPHRWRIAFVCLALAVVTCAVYWPVLGSEFVNYDDSTYITENAHVLHGLNWPDVKWAFATGYAGYAHPVTWLTHQLDYQLYGAWAGGHHLTNLAIHVVNSLLLLLLFWRITRDLWPSVFVAALFAIHPLHVESVAWVAERKDVLSGLFFVLTLHAYAAYATKRQVWRYVLALCLFVLGILSKPMLVSVPCVLLLFDYWPLRRMSFQRRKRDSAVWPNIGWLILEKIPFALVAGAWSIVTFVLQKEAGVVGHERVALRIANAIVSYATYLWNTFWPQNLAVFYPYPLTLPWGIVMVSAALLVLVSVLCIARMRYSPYLIVGWFWYLGMLVPVIGLIQAGAQAHADRYTYLPQIGLWFALSWEVAELTKSWSFRRYLLSVAATIVIAVLMARTWNQTAVWHDSESLWTHALAVTSDNLVAHYNLGHVLGQQGRYDEAAQHFTEALRIEPDFFDALINMGFTLYDQGKPAEAISYYHRALEIEPASAKAHMQLALALVKLEKGDEALQQFYKAQELAPNDPDIRANLGLMLARQGKLSEATVQLTEALRLKPDSAEAHNNLGLVLLMAGQPEKSLPHFFTALRLKPDFMVARDNLRRAQRQIDARQE